MKLTTFIQDNTERWGFIVKHPADGSEWVFEPEKLQRFIWMRAANPFGSLALRIPESLGEKRSWPRDIVSFLALEDQGIADLRELVALTETLLKGEDQALMEMAGSPLERVRQCAPIPRPRLVFGLVSNSPGPFRNAPDRRIVNLIPQGHQRPRTSVIGPGDPVVIPADAGCCGFNVELGVVIGRKGRNIPARKAMDYVAGYTCINDIAIDSYFVKHIEANRADGQGFDPDWFCEASASWGGKMADTCCAMGPYLVTRDEVGDPYDLLVYTRQSGRLRDRGHTGCMLLGIGRIIAWYSSFATLYPGDIIHMGTMAYDGLPLIPEMRMGPDDFIEVEIENMGIQRNPVVKLGQWDWRDDGDLGKRVHASPAVRFVMDSGRGEIGMGDWTPSIDRIPDFWIVYGNYTRAPQMENLKPHKFSRFLNAPNTAIGTSGAFHSVTGKPRRLMAGIELCFVVGRVAHKVDRSQADRYILGYLPMISLCDPSFGESVIEPATRQERSVAAVYGRWGDGSNIVPGQPVFRPVADTHCLPMYLNCEGLDVLSANTGDYAADAAQILEFITAYITLLPGDIVTLGRIGGIIEIPAEMIKAGITVSGSIEGLGIVQVSVRGTDATE